VEVVIKVECGGRSAKHDLAGTVSTDVVECGGEEEGEVEVEGQLDDENRMGAQFTGEVVAIGVRGCMLTKVPTGEGGGPIEVEALKTEFAEGLDEVFGGETENTGDGSKVECVGF